MVEVAAEVARVVEVAAGVAAEVARVVEVAAGMARAVEVAAVEMADMVVGPTYCGQKGARGDEMGGALAMHHTRAAENTAHLGGGELGGRGGSRATKENPPDIGLARPLPSNATANSVHRTPQTTPLKRTGLAVPAPATVRRPLLPVTSTRATPGESRSATSAVAVPLEAPSGATPVMTGAATRGDRALLGSGLTMSCAPAGVVGWPCASTPCVVMLHCVGVWQQCSAAAAAAISGGGYIDPQSLWCSLHRLDPASALPAASPQRASVTPRWCHSPERASAGARVCAARSRGCPRAQRLAQAARQWPAPVSLSRG